ncbi:MAG: hypothetical protein ACK5TD_00805, partial [bacterium]
MVLPLLSSSLVAPTSVGAQSACPTISNPSPVIITGIVTATPCLITATGAIVTFSQSRIIKPNGLASRSIRVTGSENKMWIEKSTIERGSSGIGLDIRSNENVIKIEESIIENPISGQ